jgi:hypothetical protein
MLTHQLIKMNRPVTLKSHNEPFGMDLLRLRQNFKSTENFLHGIIKSYFGKHKRIETISPWLYYT